MAGSEPPQLSGQKAKAIHAAAPISATRSASAGGAGQGEAALPSGLGARLHGAGLTPGDVQLLQRTVGNQAVQRLLAGRHTEPQPPPVDIQRRRQGPMIQRFSVTVPTDDQPGVDSTGHELVKNSKHRTVNYERTARKNVGLRVSDDGKMAVPNTYQTKDFYASEDVAKKTIDTLFAQGSGVDFIRTKDTIKAPNGQEKLIRLAPVPRGEESGVSVTDYAAKFQQLCINMAYLVSSGQYPISSGKALLKTGSEKVKQFKYPWQQSSDYHKQFPESEAEERGFNQYASPEVGEMLVTLNLLERPGKSDFEYHFAGVIAKSGADYVTLENYNRGGEAMPLLKEFLDQAKKVPKYAEEYAKLSKVYSGDNVEEKFLQVLQKTEDAAYRVTSNVNDYDTGNALWFFQMYGPPDKKVTVKSGKKNEGGSENVTIDQSFHAHMQASDDFGESLTLRIEPTIEEIATPTDDTSGIDPKVQAGISEPHYEPSFFESVSSMFSSKSKDLKKKIENLAKTGVGLYEDETIDKLEKALALLDVDENKIQADYMLKVLRLDWALAKKFDELQKRTVFFTKVGNARLKEDAAISPRHMRAMQRLIKSNVVSNFKDDIDTYEKIVSSVVSQDGYKKLIPKELKSRITSARKDMDDVLAVLTETVKMVQARSRAGTEKENSSVNGTSPGLESTKTEESSRSRETTSTESQEQSKPSKSLSQPGVSGGTGFNAGDQAEVFKRIEAEYKSLDLPGLMGEEKSAPEGVVHPSVTDKPLSSEQQSKASKFFENEGIERYHRNEGLSFWLKQNQIGIAPNSGSGMNCLILSLLQHATGQYDQKDIKEATEIREN